MSMLRSCCCLTTCNRKWTPRDEIVRNLRYSGQAIVLDSHPFAVAENLHQPLDILPTEPRDLAGGGDFAHGSGQGIGYFGLSSEEHRVDWQVKKEVEDHYHEMDQTHIGVEHDLSTPETSDGVPMQWTSADVSGGPEIVPPNCYREAAWGNPLADVVTEYGLPASGGVPNQTITYDKLLFDTGKYVMANSRLYIKCKAVGGAYIADDDGWPKTYAELTAPFVLFDVIVSVQYNYNLGPTATDIRNVRLADYYDWNDSDPPFVAPAIYAQSAAEPKPIVRQPYGAGQLWEGYPSVAAAYGTHTFNRTVRESLGVGARGRFNNGNISLDATFSARLRTTAVQAYLHPVFGVVNPTLTGQTITDTTFYPDAAYEHLSLGFPRPLTTFVVAGFQTLQIAFDAEWNADTLGVFANADPTKSVFASFIWRSDLDPADPLPEDEVTTYEGPLVGNSSRHSTLGVNGYRKPLHEGEMVYEFDLRTKTEEYYNVFDTQYAPAVSMNALWTADETRNPKWRKTPEFTEEMELASPASATLAASTGSTFGPNSSGNIVIGSGSTRPSFTAHGVGDSSTFTRGETE